MANGILLMTALVPTKGHQRVVSVADNFISSFPHGKLYVIISTRSKEPTSFDFRVKSFYGGQNAPSERVVFAHHDDDGAPQNPKSDNDEGFWGYWGRVIRRLTNNAKIDYVFASERYGQDLADITGGQFVPVDISREVSPLRGTTVRSGLFQNQADLARGARRQLSSRWVMFGQESVGKTTLAKRMAAEMSGRFYHEWARPYLETVGSEVTDERMDNIFRAQHALELDAMRSSEELLSFFDTDVLSTMGFYELYGMRHDESFWGMTRGLMRGAKKRYLLISDEGVPFEPDVLRYGGDRRESPMGFWEGVLKREGAEYRVITGRTLDDRVKMIKNIILDSTPCEGCGSYREIMGFERD